MDHYGEFVGFCWPFGSVFKLFCFYSLSFPVKLVFVTSFKLGFKLTNNRRNTMASSFRLGFTDADLDAFLAADLNVLFQGKHGVGKTHIILDAFKRNGLEFAYFSGATLDPWVSFVGVPRPIKGNNGLYLDLVRPKVFVESKVEAIFIDEFNRSHRTVRNATMELLQFKSINGYSVPSLKVVWVAINPPDTEDQFDVEELDPAQMDRFQVHIAVPYAPSLEYFSLKYPDQAKVSVDWWENLPDTVKNLVSPRRLDYALDGYLNRGLDLSFFLPVEANPSSLEENIKIGPLWDKAYRAARDGDIELAKTLQQTHEELDDLVASRMYSVQDQGFKTFWYNLLPKDTVVARMFYDPYFLFETVRNIKNSKTCSESVSPYIKANDQSPISWRIFCCFAAWDRRDKNHKPPLAATISNPYKAAMGMWMGTKEPATHLFKMDFGVVGYDINTSRKAYDLLSGYAAHVFDTLKKAKEENQNELAIARLHTRLWAALARSLWYMPDGLEGADKYADLIAGKQEVTNLAQNEMSNVFNWLASIHGICLNMENCEYKDAPLVFKTDGQACAKAYPSPWGIISKAALYDMYKMFHGESDYLVGLDYLLNKGAIQSQAQTIQAVSSGGFTSTIDFASEDDIAKTLNSNSVFKPTQRKAKKRK